MDDVDEILNENNVQNTQDEDVDMDDELEDVDVPDAEEDDEQEDEQMDEEDEDQEEDEEDQDDDEQDQDDDDDEDDDEEEDDDDDEPLNRDESQTETRDSDNAAYSVEKISDEELSEGKESSDDKPKEMSKLDKIHQYYTHLHRSASIADSYNILPTAAIPIQTHVQALAMSKGLGNLFLGGSDGFIRRFDFLNTVDGKLSLTIQQKNALVDSIVNAGILTSYWENEVPQRLSQVKWMKQKTEYMPVVSPVHSLAVQNECLFLLAGQESGGIVMQGVRYLEGRTAHYFQGHKSIVNHLLINDDETRFMSGSWDKTVREWDLETGAELIQFNATSQLSSLEFRPVNAAYKLPAGEPQTGEEDTNTNNTAYNEDDSNSLFGDDEDEANESKKDQDVDKSTEKVDKAEAIDDSYVEPISKRSFNLKTDDSIFLTSCIDGNIQVWDKRQPSKDIIKLGRNLATPPWCMSACWSADGGKVIAGRRNAIVEIYDLRSPGSAESKLKLPSISGPVSKVKAMPNNSHVVAASTDNIRIFDINNIEKTPLIIPGHHGGCISNLYVDPTCRFMISTSGNRGWQGSTTDVALIYDIEIK